MSLLDKATIITTPTAHSNGTLHSIKGGSIADFDVVRGSAATRVNAEGLIEDIATNIPRIDYTDGTASILLEPQSTNLIAYSEDFSDASWTKSGVVITSNNGVSPDGSVNASTINFSASGQYLLHNKTITTTIGSSVTISIYANTNTANFLTFGGATPSGTDVSNVESLLGGFYRHTVTRTFTIATTDTVQYIIFGAAIGGYLIYGAQLEELSYATSYIPTNGAIATRLADAVTGAGDATTFNDSEGVLYFEGSALDGSRSLGVSDGTGNNRVLILLSSGGVRGFVASNSSIVFDQTFAGVSVLDNNKIAVKYKLNDFSVWVNGVEVLTDTIGGTPIGLSELAFDNGSGATNFYGKVKSVITFNTALTDAELECLTTI